jgi:uncharacterized protein YrrD
MFQFMEKFYKGGKLVMRSMKNLLGFSVNGRIDALGEIHDLFLDDFEWVVRYLVVDTGSWLARRKILISPYSVNRIDNEENKIQTSLDYERIKDSPHIDTDRPISRQKEVELANYYQWPYYWEPGKFPGFGPEGVAAYPLEELGREIEPGKKSPAEREDTNLRSLREVRGYDLHSRDGDFGRLSDFLFTEENWKILYIVVDTGNFLSVRQVVVSPEWIEQISWDEARIYIDLSKESIANSPEFEPEEYLDRAYEERLYDHYQKKKYW